MKFIVFDGEFYEEEVEWLEDWEEGEDWDVYSKRNGLQRAWESPDGSRHQIEVCYVRNRSRPNRAWYVSVCIADGDMLNFVIEGDVNYLRFLASSFTLANVEAALATMAKS